MWCIRSLLDYVSEDLIPHFGFVSYQLYDFFLCVIFYKTHIFSLLNKT